MGKKEKVFKTGQFVRQCWPLPGGPMVQPNTLIRAFDVIDDEQRKAEGERIAYG